MTFLGISEGNLRRESQVSPKKSGNSWDDDDDSAVQNSMDSVWNEKKTWILYEQYWTMIIDGKIKKNPICFFAFVSMWNQW